MQMEEARGYVFQALRQSGWNQWGQLLSSVGMVKAQAQRIQVDPMNSMYPGSGLRHLSEPEKDLILEVVWSLIAQGILIPGYNDSNPAWPFLRLTQYGRQCVTEDRI